MDWSRLDELAQLNAVVPLATANLLNWAPEVFRSTPIYSRWTEITAEIRRRNQRRSEWAQELLAEFEQQGIEVIVLKGALFADAIYRNPAYKKMNDLDLLIRPQDRDRVVRELRDRQFFDTESLFSSGQRSLYGGHHSPPWISPDLNCVIGLHWGLVSPHSRWKPNHDRLWKRKVKADGASYWRLSWEDQLLHLCIHLPFFKTGLRELADVFNLALEASPSLDWRDFLREAERWGAEDAVYRVLSLSQALVDLRMPRFVQLTIFKKWRPRYEKMTCIDTDRKLRDPNSILRSRSTQVAKIEKAYAVFRLTENRDERIGAWLKMWQTFLWPKDVEVKKLAGSGLPDWRARLEAPRLLWGAMAREQGQAALGLMTAHGVGVAVKNILLRPFKGPGGKSIQEHPAAKLLEVLE